MAAFVQSFLQSEFHHIESVSRIPAGMQTQFQSNRVARLRGWWCEKSGGGVHMPLRSDFDILDHFDLAPNLFLAQRDEAGHFVYRVRGETVLWLFGGKERGPSVAAYTANEFQQNVDEYYQSILQDGAPVLLRGDVSFANGRSSAFESIDCPLADDEGVPRFILGLADIVPGKPLMSA